MKDAGEDEDEHQLYAEAADEGAGGLERLAVEDGHGRYSAVEMGLFTWAISRKIWGYFLGKAERTDRSLLSSSPRRVSAEKEWAEG